MCRCRTRWEILLPGDALSGRGHARRYAQCWALTLGEARAVLEQLTTALAYIHAPGILHRDIKPANILFDQDYHLYLTDFGIASWIGEKPIHKGSLLGTPHYMAPELFNLFHAPSQTLENSGAVALSADDDHLARVL